jgi:hypothetical protein
MKLACQAMSGVQIIKPLNQYQNNDKIKLA